MKLVLLWQPDYLDRLPMWLLLDDAVASAAVRAGVAAAVNPADTESLNSGGLLDGSDPTEILLQHGLVGELVRVYVPSSVVAIATSLGLASPLGGGTTPPSLPVTLPAIALALIGANPNTTYPPPLQVPNLPPEYKPGDTLRLYYDVGPDLTGNSYVDHVLTEQDSGNNATISFGTVVSSISSGVHAFAIQGRRSDAVSPISMTVIHGDTVAPSISSAVTSYVENQPIIETITLSEKVAAVAITGTDASGPNKVKVLTALPAQVIQIVRDDDANTNYEASSSYSYSLAFTDRSANTSAQIARNPTVGDQDEAPEPLTFAPVIGATTSAHYQSNEVTIAGLDAGVSAPISVTGGTYSKNGGALTSAAGSVVNGDTLKLDALAGATNNLTQNVVLTYGEPAQVATYSVSTPSTFITFSPSDKDSHIVLSNASKTATMSGAPSGNSAVARTTSPVTLPDCYAFALRFEVEGPANTWPGWSTAGAALTNLLGYHNNDIGLAGNGTLVQNDGGILAFPGATNGAGTIVNYFMCQSTGQVWLYINGYGWHAGDPGSGVGTSAPNGSPVNDASNMIPAVCLGADGAKISLVAPTIARAGFTVISG